MSQPEHARQPADVSLAEEFVKCQQRLLRAAGESYARSTALAASSARLSDSDASRFSIRGCVADATRLLYESIIQFPRRSHDGCTRYRRDRDPRQPRAGVGRADRARPGRGLHGRISSRDDLGKWAYPITWSGEYDGHAYQDTGEVLAYDKPHVLSVTHYSPLMGQDDKPANYHTIVYTLTADGDLTRITLTQDNCSDQGQAEQFSRNWLQMLEGIKTHVET